MKLQVVQVRSENETSNTIILSDTKKKQFTFFCILIRSQSSTNAILSESGMTQLITAVFR